MGEARKRGTREQRVAEGIAKRQAAEAKREAEWREYQRTRRPSAASAMLGVIAAMGVSAMVDGGAKG